LRHWVAALAITAVAVVSGAGSARADDFDLVILGGRVMDPETAFDAVRNVGIRAGRIAAITEDTLASPRCWPSEVIEERARAWSPSRSQRG